MKRFAEIAGICALCLLTACAGAGTESVLKTVEEAADVTSIPAEGASESEAFAAADSFGAALEESGEEAAAVLTDVLYEEDADTREPVVIQFVFSDQTVEECELDFVSCRVNRVSRQDLTGDGTEEVVVHRTFVNTATEYNMLDIFRVEGKEIRQIFPTEDIPELQGEACDTDIFTVDRAGRHGSGLHVQTYGKEQGVTYVKDEMDIVYESGKWVRLPERELRVEVSLEASPEFDSEEVRAYEAFLRGDSRAAISEHYYSAAEYLEPPAWMESFSLKELLEEILSGIREDRGIDGVERVEYALIDCGSDGQPELAVRIYGVSIYDRHDSSSLVLIFDCEDGRAELIYAVDMWARSDTTVYPDGYISSGGSGGAATHYIEAGIIGADSVYRTAYDMHIETGQCLYGMSAYEPIDSEELPAEFYECALGEDTVYSYFILEDISEDVRANVLAYIAENERQMGMKFLTYEEMAALIDVRKQSLGITREMTDRLSWEAEGIAWRTLAGCEDYLYDEG